MGLVLMGGSMLSKSLIQFSVDGCGYFSFLLSDLRPNYGGGNEDNGDLLQMVPQCTAILSAPNPAPGHRQPIPMLETPGPSRASLGQTPLGHCSFLLGRGSGSCGGRNNKINSYLLSVCYVQATFKSFICINNVILLIVLLGGPYY